MAEALFRSGPWVGFYTYRSSARRFLMDLNLRFRAGRIEGDGADGLDTFLIAGFYDARKRECGWQKIYPTRPAVTYFGYREDKGIWGTWNVKGAEGGFQIWPLSEGSAPDLRDREAVKETEEVVTAPLAPIHL